MKVLSKLMLHLTVAFLLVGCATSGPTFSELAPSISNLPPDTGRIFLYRTSIFGAAIQPNVELNGEVIGQAVPLGFFYVDRQPGSYEIMTSTEVDRKLSFTLEKRANPLRKSKYFYRILCWSCLSRIGRT